MWKGGKFLTKFCNGAHLNYRSIARDVTSMYV